MSAYPSSLAWMSCSVHIHVIEQIIATLAGISPKVGSSTIVKSLVRKASLTSAKSTPAAVADAS